MQNKPSQQRPVQGKHAAGSRGQGQSPASVRKPASKASAAKRKPAAKKKPSAGRLTPGQIARRVGLCVGTLIALVLVAALGAGYVGFRGPSQSLGDLLTVSMLETSALKIVPYIYHSSAEVKQIVARNEVAAIEDETDTSMIVINGPTPEPGAAPVAPAQTRQPELADVHYHLRKCSCNYKQREQAQSRVVECQSGGMPFHTAL